MDDHLGDHSLLVVLKLLAIREISKFEEVAELDEGSLLEDIGDVVASVEQLTLLAVDVGYVRGTGSRACEAGIEGEHACVVVEGSYIYHGLSSGRLDDI